MSFFLSLFISEDLTKLRYRHCIYINAYTGYSSEEHSKSLCINIKEVQIKEAVFSKTSVTEAKRSIYHLSMVVVEKCVFPDQLVSGCWRGGGWYQVKLVAKYHTKTIFVIAYVASRLLRLPIIGWNTLTSLQTLTIYL